MLAVTDLEAAYGAVPVLTGVSFTLADGEIVVLFGRNGVGKTTLMRALVGLLKPARGQVVLDGRNVTGLPPHQIARHRVAYVPQGRGVFPKLSVYENLLVGTRARGDGSTDIPGDIVEMFPWLKERLDQPGGTLSGGQQQMLVLARAMCGRPQYLLLDEPSEGIQPTIVQQIGDVVADLRSEAGVSVLLVEQNLDLGLRLADRCLVMEKGAIAYEGSPTDFQDEALLRRYLAI